MNTELEQAIWERVCAPIIGSANPRASEIPKSIDEVGEEHIGIGLMFKVRSTFAHRPGSGFITMRIAREFREDEPAYTAFLEERLKQDVASQCPYARRFVRWQSQSSGMGIFRH